MTPTLTFLVMLFGAFVILLPLGLRFLANRAAGRGRDDLMGAPRAPLNTPVGSSPKPSLLDATGIAGEIQPEIEELLARGKKIAAIKLLRERSGLGLKEAKDAVEMYARVSRLG